MPNRSNRKPKPRPLGGVVSNSIHVCAHYKSRNDPRERGTVEASLPVQLPKAVYLATPWVGSAMRGSYGYPTRDSAESGIETARRTVAFMDVAELRPSKAFVRVFGTYFYPAGRGLDHTRVWRATAGGYVVTTEPYEGRKPIMPEWDCREARAWGMWNPPSTVLYLCSPAKNGADLDPIMARLRAATLP